MMKLTDVVEIIHKSEQSTYLGIADEILQRQLQRRIVEVHLAPSVLSIDLPTISFPFQKRGYRIALSPLDEDTQLSQICTLILVALERIPLEEYGTINSFRELFDRSSEYEEIFNTIKKEMTDKALSIF